MKTIRFNFDSTNAGDSLESLRALLRCMQNPTFSSASLRYTSNLEFPLVLRVEDTTQELWISGVVCEPKSNISRKRMRPYTLDILKVANFKIGEPLAKMILSEPQLNVTIWNIE